MRITPCCVPSITARGERAFATEIQHTEVAPLEGPTDDSIPLVDLENFIRWRKERRNH